jgi:hypothetical protein
MSWLSCRSAAQLGEQLCGVLASAEHPVLKAVAEPVLRPCVEACLAPGTRSDTAARGAAWALLGAARLALVAPPAGADPAGKHAFKRAHLLRVVDEEVLPELWVRALLFFYPVDFLGFCSWPRVLLWVDDDQLLQYHVLHC